MHVAELPARPQIDSTFARISPCIGQDRDGLWYEKCKEGENPEDDTHPAEHGDGWNEAQIDNGGNLQKDQIAEPQRARQSGGCARRSTPPGIITWSATRN